MTKRDKRLDKTSIVPATRYRNPMATAAIMKKGGRHEKSNKAKRLEKKAEVKKMLKTMKNNHSHGLFLFLRKDLLV